MTIWALLPAAGIGRRMESNTPKQYHSIDGVSVIIHSLRRLSAVAAIKKIVVVLHPDDRFWPKLQDQVAVEFPDLIQTVIGGDERCKSVLNGLYGLANTAQLDDWVLVHDAVRPCVRTADIENLINRVQQQSTGGLLGYPVDNTLKKVDERAAVLRTVNRETIWNALTPQMFRYSLLRDAIESVMTSTTEITDEASAVESAGHKPVMVVGSKDNIKVTRETDLQLAAQILRSQANADES